MKSGQVFEVSQILEATSSFLVGFEVRQVNDVDLLTGCISVIVSLRNCKKITCDSYAIQTQPEAGLMV